MRRSTADAQKETSGDARGEGSRECSHVDRPVAVGIEDQGARRGTAEEAAWAPQRKPQGRAAGSSQGPAAGSSQGRSAGISQGPAAGSSQGRGGGGRAGAWPPAMEKARGRQWSVGDEGCFFFFFFPLFDISTQRVSYRVAGCRFLIYNRF
jgi:hypothetical protein